MVLYAVGPVMRVFALSQVKGDVYPSGNERWPYRMNVVYRVNLSASDGIPIEQVSTPDRDLRRSVRQRSYIRLRASEFARAETMLREREHELSAACGTGRVE